MNTVVNMLIGAVVVIIFYVNLAAMNSGYAPSHPVYSPVQYVNLVQRVIAQHKNPPLGQQQVLMNYLKEECDIMLERQPSSWSEVNSFWKRVQEISKSYPQSIVEDIIRISKPLRNEAMQYLVEQVYSQQFNTYRERQIPVNGNSSVADVHGPLQKKYIELMLYPDNIARSYARIKELRKLAEVAHILLHDAAVKDFFSGS